MALNEIDHSEIVLNGFLGTFSKVHKARCKNQDVAVKYIMEKDFILKVNQLAQLHHNNIVKLYGVCTQRPNVCLVMEVADGGSVHDVLYGSPRIEYELAHAMSWMKQCAEAVAYLHAVTPRPIIHRNLKPQNLLLFNEHTLLKVSDFDMATELKTHMTKQKGTVAYMAPEVFMENHYIEKCDVYSWSIILWEVTSRQPPFNGLRQHEIMDAVEMSNRPSLNQKYPETILNLMTKCWDQNPDLRPAMQEVFRKMLKLCNDYPGGKNPIAIPMQTEFVG